MAEEHTDPAGYEINLTDLAEDLKRLDTVTEYFTDQLAKLSELKSHPMARLAGGGAPDAEMSAIRDDFVRKWTAAADRLLGKRTELINSVKSFTGAMHDVHDTYAKAEGENADNFRSIGGN